MHRALPLLLLLLCVACTDAPPGTPPSVTLMLPQVDASIPVGLAVDVRAQAVAGSGVVVAIGWSSDRDGELAWAEPDGSGIGSATATFDTVGEHVITVTAFDRLGGEGTDTATVRVRTATAPFLTVTSPWSGGTYFADAVLLEATVDDVEHERADLGVVWTEDGVELASPGPPDAFGEVAQTITTTEGSHTYVAMVTDPDGQTTSDTITISVGPPNTDPDCAIVDPVDPAERPQGAPVTFVIQAIDAETASAALTWTLSSNVDGALATGVGDDDPVEQIEALSDDGHLVTLTVEDGFGGVCVDTVAITMRDCDLDLDGATATDCGGGDCNDGDPAIGPFVGDVAGDGIDTDCDGLDCGAGFDAEGVYFAACFPVLDQPASAQACVDAGYPGIASVRNAVEELFVTDLAAPVGAARLWIGLANASGAWWSWADGSSAFYRPWIPGQPDLATFPACAEVTYAGGWSDLPCDASYLNLGMVCALRP